MITAEDTTNICEEIFKGFVKAYNEKKTTYQAQYKGISSDVTIYYSTPIHIKVTIPTPVSKSVIMRIPVPRQFICAIEHIPNVKESMSETMGKELRVPDLDS